MSNLQSKPLKKHPLTIAWEKWIESEEGKKCMELPIMEGSEQYLRNRLHAAFAQGWDEGKKSLTASKIK